MKIGIREIIFIVLLLGIPVAAKFFVFKPNDTCDAAMVQQIADRRAKLYELTLTTAKIGDLQREVNGYEKAIDTLQAKLPSEKEMDRVLQEIWQLASQNNLSAKLVKTLNRGASDMAFTDANSPHREQPVTITVDGDFIGFYRFLQQLEARPRIMRIQQMEIKQLPKDNPGTIEASFTMSIFFEASKENPA